VKRKPPNPRPEPGLVAAEEAWFRLRLWCTDRPPFVGAMTGPQRAELRAVCQVMADTLDLVLGKGG
jgi:hypothetical protein